MDLSVPSSVREGGLAASPAPRAGLTLAALSLGSFTIGCGEFGIMGLLPNMADDLRVTIPQAGLLVTGYALGVVFGAPLLAVLTSRWERRRALLLLSLVFVIGNLACALSPTYGLLMAARVFTALAHGTFFGIGAVLATEIARPGREAQAIAQSLTVLRELQAIPDQRIPDLLLSKAEGIVILPANVKVGLIFGARFGNGVMLVRNEDRSWSNPVFVSTGGGSWGFQAASAEATRS